MPVSDEKAIEMISAVESVLAKIGDHFGVEPGDVDGLFAAIEAQAEDLSVARQSLYEVAEQRNSLSAEVSGTWQSDPPKAEGYWWWRQGDRIEPSKIVDIGDGELEVWFIGERDPLARWSWQPEWRWMPMSVPVSGTESPTTCEWFEDDDGWHSGCGQWWDFTYDGPKENGVAFCMFCSKPVTIAEFVDGRESL